MLCSFIVHLKLSVQYNDVHISVCGCLCSHLRVHLYSKLLLSLEKDMAGGSQHVADIDEMVFMTENWLKKKDSLKAKCIQQTGSFFKRHVEF